MNARLFALAIPFVLALGLHAPASAQLPAVVRTAPEIDRPVAAFPAARAAIVQDATLLDLEGMDAAGWEALGRETRRGLRSRNPMNRMQSLQNVLLLTKHHPGRVDFARATHRLCRIARYDRYPELRMMAVAALRAVDNVEAMAFLVDHMHDWQPAKVRKLTRAAVADYVRAGRRLPG